MGGENPGETSADEGTSADSRPSNSEQSSGGSEETGEQTAESDPPQPLTDDSRESEANNQGELTSQNQSASDQVDAETSKNSGKMINASSGMTADEARKLLQSIRDRQMARRALLKQRAKQRATRVEKDW